MLRAPSRRGSSLSYGRQFLRPCRPPHLLFALWRRSNSRRERIHLSGAWAGTSRRRILPISEEGTTIRWPDGAHADVDEEFAGGRERRLVRGEVENSAIVVATDT